MRILLTGHTGYIGSVMAAHLVEAGHEVTGLDAGLFDECLLTPRRVDLPRLAVASGDIRDVTARDLEGFEAIVHLAALSNDPLSDLNEDWTMEINHRASVWLAEQARAAGVERFVFSSSCIMYGAAEAQEVDETSPLDPRTAYARSKVAAEREIAALATPHFSPVFLRNGTVYGLSPAMRFDTVLNSLTGAAVATGRITIHGDGEPWRPVVHVEDVAALFAAVLAAPRELLHNEAINAATAAANYRIIQLAEAVARAVPGAEVERLGSPSADRRTYRANFDKLARLLPGYRPRWTVEAGAAQLAAELTRLGLTAEQFDSPRYTRLRWLRAQIDAGRLGARLRPAAGVEVAA